MDNPGINFYSQSDASESLKRSEQLNARLRQQYAEYDLLLESAGVCIVKVRMDENLTLDWCNEASYKAVGYTKEEYEAQFGYDVRSFFRGREELFRPLADACKDALQSGRQHFQTIAHIPSRTGHLWAQCAGTFTDTDPKTGVPAYVYVIFTDVTAVVETRKKLDEADRKNAWLVNILDNIPAGVSICMVEDGRMLSITINRHLADHLGISNGEFTLESLDQILAYVHVADREECGKSISEFLEQEGKLDLICRIRHSGTADFSWMHVEGRIVISPDNSKAAFVTYTDISVLKETEKTLREAVTSANLIVWEYDIPGHTIHMADNDTSEKECLRLGLNRVISNVPESLVEILDERSVPAFLEMYRKVEEGRNASCEIWYKRRLGQEPRCERVSYTVDFDEEGRPVRAYAVGINITAEKNIEERYARERSYLQENRDFNLISKGRYNLTQNRVLEYSMQADKTPGGNYFDTHSDMTYDEAAEALFHMPCPEEDRAALIDAVDRQRLLQRYQEGHLLSRAQYRRLRKGNLPLWMSVEMRTFASPLTGDIECFSYTYDITDKVQNEEIMDRIAATEFDYVGLIYSCVNLFEFLQKSDKITFPEAHVKTSYSECCAFVRGNFVADDELDQYDSAVSLQNILSGLKASGRWSSTYRRTENGKIYCKQIDYSWLDQDEGIILAVRTDITASYERDQAQISGMQAAKLEADRANEAKSAFLSNMSHDMRTPLNAVLGFTDLALREEDMTVKQDYLKKVKSSGDLLLNLVNDTLEMSRIESGKFVLEPEAVYGREVWESVITALRPAAELKNIALITRNPEDLDETLWVDRLKLQKILLNLISNAIKYTPEGGTVHASVERLEPAENGFNRRIIVEDNGIGISPEFLPQVFEPFAQEHRTETKNVAGTGLGLSIAKRIIDLMGGSIQVISKLNCGTRFTVELPLTVMKNGKIRGQKESHSLASLTGKKVLLCEDNDLNAEIVTILLREKGMEVDHASDGAAGVRNFADSMNGYYDAVLMDIRMPVMDGYAAVKKIRSLNRSDAKTVPIYAMTADAFEEDIRRAHETGMNGYLAKPIDPEKLCRMLADGPLNEKCENTDPNF